MQVFKDIFYGAFYFQLLFHMTVKEFVKIFQISHLTFVRVGVREPNS